MFQNIGILINNTVQTSNLATPGLYERVWYASALGALLFSHTLSTRC